MAEVTDPAEEVPSTEAPAEAVEEAEEIVVEEASTDESAVATASLTDEQVQAPSERVVFIDTAPPPKTRSNRVVGVVLALVGAGIFAVAYAGAAFVVMSLAIPANWRNAGLGSFLRDASFWVPVLLFSLAFVLLVALLNRAAWWAHVLGSLLVAFVVYLGTSGLLFVLNNVTGGPEVSFGDYATNPFLIVAALLAREVSMWVGFLIARRGVKVTARNRATREAFEAEQAAKRAAAHGEATASA